MFRPRFDKRVNWFYSQLIYDIIHEQFFSFVELVNWNASLWLTFDICKDHARDGIDSYDSPAMPSTVNVIGDHQKEETW